MFITYNNFFSVEKLVRLCLEIGRKLNENVKLTCNLG